MLAMVEAVAEEGYRETSVADVLSLAGVSRRTFYEHFPNKQACFLETYDQVTEAALRRVERAYVAADGWPDRAEAAILALFEAAIESPGAVRLALVEINVLGTSGIRRRQQAMARYERFIAEAVGLAPGRGQISEAVLKSVVGGLSRVLCRRVLGGGRTSLLAAVPELVSWVTSYYPTPASIVAQPRRSGRSGSRGSATPLTGGRAPGTLATHFAISGRRGLRGGDQSVSRSFVVHSQRERILDAVTNLTAAEGYMDLKVEDVAAHAAVSLGAFYEHFTGKEDALLVAYEVGHRKALAATEHAYAAAGSWEHAVRDGLGALLEFLASESSFAHIALVDVLVATARTAERSNLGVDALARMLVPDPDEAPAQQQLAPVTIEAIAGGIFDLCLQYVLAGKTRELPELAATATYIALAPFLGGSGAARVALAPR